MTIGLSDVYLLDGEYHTIYFTNRPSDRYWYLLNPDGRPGSTEGTLGNLKSISGVIGSAVGTGFHLRVNEPYRGTRDRMILYRSIAYIV